MAIHIDTTSKKKTKAPTAKAGVQKQQTLSPVEQLIAEVGEDTFDRLVELQIEIDQFKPVLDEFEKLRGTVDKASMKILDKTEKFYVQREHGLIEIPACSNTTELVDKALAKERLKDINPKLVDECFTPAITKLKSYLSGPMAEGVFKTVLGKSRKPKVKVGK